MIKKNGSSLPRKFEAQENMDGSNPIKKMVIPIFNTLLAKKNLNMNLNVVFIDAKDVKFQIILKEIVGSKIKKKTIKQTFLKRIIVNNYFILA